MDEQSLGTKCCQSFATDFSRTWILRILENPRGGALEFTDRVATGCLILGQASKG